MEKNDEKTGRRAAFSLGAAATLGALGLLSKSSTSHAAAGGAAAAAAIGKVVAELKRSYEYAQQLKTEYYDEHIKSFNAQVKSVNETLQTTKDLYKATQAVEKWSEYLKGERKYAVDFIKTYFSGKQDFNTLELKEYDRRHSALSKILASQKSVMDRVNYLDGLFEKVASDLSAEKREEAQTAKRLQVVLSNARLQSDESEIRMDALKHREKIKIKALDASPMDELQKVHLKDSLNLASIKDLLEVNNRLLIAANDLKEVEIRILSEQNVTSRYGDKAVDSKRSKMSVDNMKIGQWGSSPER